MSIDLGPRKTHNPLQLQIVMEDILCPKTQTKLRPLLHSSCQEWAGWLVIMTAHRLRIEYTKKDRSFSSCLVCNSGKTAHPWIRASSSRPRWLQFSSNMTRDNGRQALVNMPARQTGIPHILYRRGPTCEHLTSREPLHSHKGLLKGKQ